jgi:hypothetical protein
MRIYEIPVRAGFTLKEPESGRLFFMPSIAYLPKHRAFLLINLNERFHDRRDQYRWS